jgi:hypothetical protein
MNTRRRFVAAAPGSSRSARLRRLPAFSRSPRACRSFKIAFCGGDATMGIGVLNESAIKTPKDRERRQMASTVTSREYPFRPADPLSLCDPVHLRRHEGWRDNGDDRRSLSASSSLHRSGWATSSCSPHRPERRRPSWRRSSCYAQRGILYGFAAFAELVMRRWYGGEIAVGGFV